MNVKENIKEAQCNLINYIKDKIYGRVKNHLNWLYTIKVVDLVHAREVFKSDKVYSEEILPILKKNFPLAVTYISHSPMMLVFNNLNNYSNGEMCMFENNMRGKIQNRFCYIYYYTELERLGYGRDFSKRTIDEAVENGIFYRKRVLGGVGLFVDNLTEIVNNAKRQDTYMRLCPEGIEKDELLDWIFETVDDATLDDFFTQGKNQMLEIVNRT